MLAEQTFSYEGKEWPPKGSGDGWVIEGVVKSGVPLKVRKAHEMQGYLKSTAAADVADKRYAITITEFQIHTVEDDVEHPLYDIAWAFVWQVNAVLNTITEITVEDSVEDPLASWGNALLECVINRLKPAHTDVLFSYS